MNEEIMCQDVSGSQTNVSGSQTNSSPDSQSPVQPDVQDIIEKTVDRAVDRTVVKLKMVGLIKDDRKTAYQKTEELLRNYPKFKLSDQPYAIKLCERVEQALDMIRSDYYFDLIKLYYFDRVTREEISGKFNTSDTTISRNKKRLVSSLSAALFSDDLIYELFL